jgi:hypothetical protein
MDLSPEACAATGAFTELSDRRAWVGAVLMGGRKNELTSE